MIRLGFNFLFLSLAISVTSFGQTFGLGGESVQTAVSYQDSFGLAIEQSTPIKPTPAIRTRTTIIDRSRSTWTDPAIGSWTTGKLTAHLRGSLGDAQHRGIVPVAELTGRTLDELLVMHANLHEGWSWDGSTLIRDSPKPVAVKPQVVYRSTSNCPGGVCPTNTNFRGRLFRWR